MKEISPLDLRDRIAASDHLIIIDVREPDEHERFSIGGTNIPVTELPFRIDEIKNMGNADIVLYCQSGNRSALAQRLLASQFNIQNTLNLTGGMIRWRDEIGDESV